MPSTTGQVYLGSNLINNLRFNNNPTWTRPADWIAMPTITSSEQKVAALFLAGDNNSNFVAFRCAGNYTVDWGDGIIENVTSAVTAQHNYVFSDLSPTTEFGPVGSKSRQAMIVITPQAGQNLTSIQFNFKHTSVASTVYTTPILEITLSAPNCTTLLIGGTQANLRLLEQCTILSHKATGLANLFQNCSSLRSIPLFPISPASSVGSMFLGCSSLQSVPLFDLSTVPNLNGMFSGCSSLRSVPLFNTSAATNMSSMFQNCVSLQTIPAFNTAAATNMATMFQNCTSLQSVPAFNTSAATNMSSMFQNCVSLQTIPALNCSSATNMNSFAATCHALKRCLATGVRASVSFLNSTLSASNLNEIYSNLANLTSLPTQTITVTGNYGTATDNPAIATAKNWTVAG
jgi:surface protein